MHAGALSLLPMPSGVSLCFYPFLASLVAEAILFMAVLNWPQPLGILYAGSKLSWRIRGLILVQ